MKYILKSRTNELTILCKKTADYVMCLPLYAVNTKFLKATLFHVAWSWYRRGFEDARAYPQTDLEGFEKVENVGKSAPSDFPSL